MFTSFALPVHPDIASEGNAVRGFTRVLSVCFFWAVAIFLGSAEISFAQDVAGSKDPAGMQRYEGSTLIGYRAPKFDEYLLPLGEPTQGDPPTYEKSMPVEGQVSYYTYLAPAGRSPAELFRNYKQEFQRLGVEVMYEKSASQRGWFGPTFDKISSEVDLGQILEYAESDERLLVGKTKDGKPSYYEIFITAY
jgi:hypothetical protein